MTIIFRNNDGMKLEYVRDIYMEENGKWQLFSVTVIGWNSVVVETPTQKGMVN